MVLLVFSARSSVITFPFFDNNVAVASIICFIVIMIVLLKHLSIFFLFSTLLQLICTVTPASSNSEETHNTLKFAHRSKQVEIKASQNKVNARLIVYLFVVLEEALLGCHVIYILYLLRLWMRSRL